MLPKPGAKILFRLTAKATGKRGAGVRSLAGEVCVLGSFTTLSRLRTVERPVRTPKDGLKPGLAIPKFVPDRQRTPRSIVSARSPIGESATPHATAVRRRASTSLNRNQNATQDRWHSLATTLNRTLNATTAMFANTRTVLKTTDRATPNHVTNRSIALETGSPGATAINPAARGQCRGSTTSPPLRDTTALTALWWTQPAICKRPSSTAQSLAPATSETVHHLRSRHPSRHLSRRQSQQGRLV